MEKQRHCTQAVDGDIGSVASRLGRNLLQLLGSTHVSRRSWFSVMIRGCCCSVLLLLKVDGHDGCRSLSWYWLRPFRRPATFAMRRPSSTVCRGASREEPQ